MPEQAPMTMIEFILKNHISDWASVIGVCISVIGFIALIWNVIRTKSATKNTQDAVIEVTKDIKRINVVSELSAALIKMEEIKAMQLKNKFNELPKLYFKLRQKLITIREVYPNITDKDSTIIQKAITLFYRTENQLAEHINKDEDPQDIMTQYKRVNTCIDDLNAMLISIKNQIGRYEYEK